MADEQQDNALSATFPAPPPFYKHFTADNLARIEQARSAASTSTDQNESATAVDTKLREAADLPADLRCLVPPAIPTSDEFRSFGETFNVRSPLPQAQTAVPTLTTQKLTNPLPAAPPAASSIPHLDLAVLPSVPHAEIQPTLLRLTRSILLAFLELVSVLATNPDFVEAKLRDIETLFGATHTLVNVYRPHQARETLIEMMEARVARGKREMQELKEMGGKVDAVLAGLGAGEGRVGETAGEDAASGRGVEGDRQRERERRVWATLDGIAMPDAG